MRIARISAIFALIAEPVALGLGATALGGGFPADCTTDVSAPASQPPNTPILITVTITNRGDAPVRYFSTGSYPNPALFEGTITDALRQVQPLLMSNEEADPGSRWSRRLKPHESIDMPAMIDPLPVGSYTIQVARGRIAKITIKDDMEVARKWDEDLLAKIRKGDPFADHVAYVYLQGKDPHPYLFDKLLQDLVSGDEVVAERAANTLYRARELPVKSEAIISQASAKYLRLLKERGFTKPSILGALAGLGSKIGTDGALESVLTLARTQEVRGNAVWALGKFKQEKAAQELRRLLKDESEELQFRAAQGLAERKDPAALDILLAVAHDPKSRWRAYSFESLLKYSDDPRVEPAIKTGLNNPDSFVRQSAEFALRNLHPAKKP
jgi:hypothetical protein